jgi:polysaccharide chain length determinant protein (PEP-CTERM system associated)
MPTFANLSLREMLHKHIVGFWRRRWWTAVIVWVLSIAGLSFIAMLPNTYTSSARLFVDTQSLLGPLMRGMTVQQDVRQQIDIIRRTLLARPNIEKLMRLTDLDVTVETPQAMDAKVQELARRITLESEGDFLFRISFSDRDPQLAQRVVQSVLDIFVEQNVGNTRNNMDSAMRFIQNQIADYEKQLREAENRIAAFRRDNGDALGATARATTDLERAQTELRQVTVERDAATWQRNQLRGELSRTPQYMSDAAAANTGTAGRSVAMERLVELNARLEQLLLVYTEEHPDVIATRRLIEAAERQANGMGTGSTQGGTIPNPLYAQLQNEIRRQEASIAMLDARRGAVELEIARLKRAADDVPQVQAQFTQLTRDYDVLVANYRSLIERRESARMARNMDDQTQQVEFRIVEPPLVPANPSGPNRILLLFGVLVVSLGVGFGVAVLFTEMSRAFFTPRALLDAFDLPLLGTISTVVSGEDKRRTRLEGMVIASSAAALALVFLVSMAVFSGNWNAPNLDRLFSATQEAVDDVG